MFTDHISVEVILFFILYGITGVVPAIAAFYLLLRRGNAFAPEVTSPVRLRRWASSFFAVSTLAHVWWLLFYLYSGDIHSVVYMVFAILDSVLLFTTFAGTLLAMLQDRHRSVWPALMGIIPFVVMSAVYVVYPRNLLIQMASIYLLLLSLLFTAYMVFAIRQYGRWLNDNYADLENKKVWLCQAVSLVCMLLFVVYVLATDMVLIWLIHGIELVLVALLLWRVETLPTLETFPQALLEKDGSDDPQEQADELSTSLTHRAIAESEQLVTEGREEMQKGEATSPSSNIEQLLAEHCVEAQLYLQHDLTLQQLAQTIGTNRSYLSQYFSSQGVTYNTYINNLRINHFITLYHKATAAHQPIVAQQLASDSGYHSYSTFSLAFKQRMGQSVTAWMRNTTNL